MKDISKILKELNVLNHNKGCSTGLNWFANGRKKISYSPVDGKKIAEISEASKRDYEKVVLIDNRRFRQGEFLNNEILIETIDNDQITFRNGNTRVTRIVGN